MSKADNLASLLNSSGLIDSDDISVGAVSAAKLAAGSVDSDILGAGSVTDNKYGGTLSVSNGDITVGGTITDDVSDVRTPRFTSLSTDTTISNEGVYRLNGGVSTITLGNPAVGTVMAIYNNTTDVTLEDGNTITSLRLGADNNATHNNTLTLGQNSMTTITVIAANACIVTGTDVT